MKNTTVECIITKQFSNFLLEIIPEGKLSSAACLNFTACTALDNEILNCRTHDVFASDHNFSFQISEFDWDAMRFSILNLNIEICFSFTCCMIYINHIVYMI